MPSSRPGLRCHAGIGRHLSNPDDGPGLSAVSRLRYREHLCGWASNRRRLREELHFGHRLPGPYRHLPGLRRRFSVRVRGGRLHRPLRYVQCRGNQRRDLHPRPANRHRCLPPGRHGAPYRAVHRLPSGRNWRNLPGRDLLRSRRCHRSERLSPRVLDHGSHRRRRCVRGWRRLRVGGGDRSAATKPRCGTHDRGHGWRRCLSRHLSDHGRRTRHVPDRSSLRGFTRWWWELLHPLTGRTAA
jgi:hypothetical protein